MADAVDWEGMGAGSAEFEALERVVASGIDKLESVPCEVAVAAAASALACASKMPVPLATCRACFFLFLPMSETVVSVQLNTFSLIGNLRIRVEYHREKRGIWAAA